MSLNTAPKCVNGSGRANSQIIRPLFKIESPDFRRDIHADLVYSRTGYHVISYFRSAFFEVLKKAAENAASGGFGSNFSGAAFNQLLSSPHFARMPIFATHKIAHRLLGCPHIAHFAICAGALKFFCIWCNGVSRRRQISRVKDIGSVFKSSGAAFRLVPPYGGLLVTNASMKIY